MVMDAQKTRMDSLPNDIKDLLLDKKDNISLILIEDQIPKERNQIAFERKQVALERKLVISEEMQEKETFVKIDNITTYMYLTYNKIPPMNQSFDKLIVGDPNKVEMGEVIEVINHYGLTPILSLSYYNYLAGWIIVVLVLTIIIHRKVALWNVPAMITCYSFQFFLGNLVAYFNDIKVDRLYLVFGFLFIITLPLTFMLKKFEESSAGKNKIHEYYLKNKSFFFKSKN
jgi:hypothetical protein